MNIFGPLIPVRLMVIDSELDRARKLLRDYKP
jgi:hypothetical protein